MILEDRLSQFQQILQDSVEQAILDDAYLRGVPHGLYTYKELYVDIPQRDAETIREDIVSSMGDITQERELRQAVDLLASIPLPEIKRLRDVDRLVSRYRDLFVECVAAYRHLTHHHYGGWGMVYKCTLQSALPSVVEERHRGLSREALLVHSREEITEESLPQLFDRLSEIREMYLFDAYDERGISSGGYLRR